MKFSWRKLKLCGVPHDWCASISVLIFFMAGCSDLEQEAGLGGAPMRLSQSANRILGFEDTSDWEGAVGAAPDAQEGAVSQHVLVNQWTEVWSIPLSSLGDVGDAVRIAIRTDQSPAWGDVRLIFRLPSSGIYWAETTAVSLVGNPTGIFNDYTFQLPENIQAALSGTYDDLQIIVALNADNMDTYLDDIRFVQSAISNTTEPLSGNTSIKVFTREEAPWETNHFKLRMYVQNDGTRPLSDFTIKYYLTVDAGKIPVLETGWYHPNCTVSLQQVNHTLWNIVYDFSEYTLLPGQTVPNTSGNVVGFHYSDWSSVSRVDDPSFAGMDDTFNQNFNVVVEDFNGIIQGTSPEEATAYRARHRVRKSDFSNVNDELNAAGYMMTYIDGYVVDGVTRFAGIWRKTPDVSTIVEPALDGPSYVTRFFELIDDGYRLVCLDPFVENGVAKFASVWQKRSGAPWRTNYNLTPLQLVEKIAQNRSDGYHMVQLNGYVVDGNRRFTAIWERSYEATQWVKTTMTHDEYQAEYERTRDLGYDLIHLDAYNFNGEPRFAAIWQKGDNVIRAVHGKSSREYQAFFDNYTFTGHRLQMVTGYQNADGEARYGAFWHPWGIPQYALNDIDALIEQFLTTHTPSGGLSIALSQEGRLVYARGFGVANEAGDLMTPYHYFRIASISKSITSAAIMKLIFDDGKFLLTDHVFSGKNIGTTGEPQMDEDGLLGIEYGSLSSDFAGGRVPNDSYIYDITVEQLLEHAVGTWSVDSANGYDVDPMRVLKDMTVANPSYIGSGFASVHHELVATVVQRTRNVGFASPSMPADMWLMPVPGNSAAYSNFGYYLLSRIIEEKTGRDYEEYVRNEILIPAGLDNMQLARLRCAGWDPFDDPAGSFEAQLCTEVGTPTVDEVHHFGGSYGRLGGLPDGNQAYADYSFEMIAGNGGWMASMVDLVRWGSLLDETQVPPFFDSMVPIAAMKSRTTPAGQGGIHAKGLKMEYDFNPGSPNSPRQRSNYRHGGTLSGATSYLWCWQGSGIGGGTPNTYEDFCLAITSNDGISHDNLHPLAMSIIDSLPHVPDASTDPADLWPDYDLFPSYY